MKLVVGVSGASGAPYAARLLGWLAEHGPRQGVQVDVVFSETGLQVWRQEVGGPPRLPFPIWKSSLILIVLGLIPKMAALVESLPQFVLGGAGLVMFGMVAATGIRILAGVDYKTNKNNLYIVAVSISAGMIPLVAPAWSQHMPHSLHPLLESGILLTTICAVVLNLFFNGARGDAREAIDAFVESRPVVCSHFDAFRFFAPRRRSSAPAWKARWPAIPAPPSPPSALASLTRWTPPAS